VIIVANGRRILHNIQVIAIFMTKGRIIAIICVAIFLSSSFRAYVVSIDTSTTAEILNQETHVKNAQGNNSSMDIGNYSKGGYHLATGEWWEPSDLIDQTFNHSDWDNDGISNSNDTLPVQYNAPLSNINRIFGINFTEPITIFNQSADGAFSSWAFDFNGDGRKELMVDEKLYTITNNYQLIPYISDNNSQGGANGGSYGSANQQIQLIDFNMDGRMDINSLGGVYLQNAVGNFSKYSYPTYTGANWWEFDTAPNSPQTTSHILDVKDIDNDGDFDFIIAYDSWEYVSVVRNDGNSYNELFTNSYYVDGQINSSVFVDFDGDNDSDIIDCSLNIVENQGLLGYSKINSTNEVELAWCDITAIPSSDGSESLLIDHKGMDGSWPPWHSYLISFSVDGSGNVSSQAQQIPLPGPNPNNDRRGCSESSVFDINNDGSMDLICGASPYIQIFTSKDNRIDNIPESVFNSNISFTGMRVMDYDEDGDGDILISNQNGVHLFRKGGSLISSMSDLTIDTYSDDDFGSPNSLYYEVQDRDEDGWSEWGACGENISWQSIASCDNGHDVADIDEDGVIEKLTIGFATSLYLSSSEMSSVLIDSTNSSQTIFQFRDAAFIDIDGDDSYEVALLIANGTVQIYNWTWDFPRNSNTPVFNQIQSLSARTGSWTEPGSYLQVEDINQDGNEDLVIVWRDPNINSQDGIDFFLSNGQSISTNQFWSYNKINPSTIDFFDVNNDGILDPAITYENAQGEVFLSNQSFYPSVPSWTSGANTPLVMRYIPVNENTMGLFLGYTGMDYIHCIANNNIHSDSCWQSYDSVSTINSFVLRQSSPDANVLVRIGDGNTRALYYISDYDSDLVSDITDEFDENPTQNIDMDDDGFGENQRGMEPDSCVGDWGDSWRDRWGCPDLDKDGQSDLYDDYINKLTQWVDSDGDGLGDNWGDVSINATRPTHWPGQWLDSAYNPDPFPLDFDNDGKEDEGLNGSQGPFDDCPYTYGTSTIDRVGCIDSDSDGFSDPDSNWGVLDGADNFPSEQTQWNDSDGDGYGDNQAGKDADAYPDDPTQWSDFDGDGYGDNPNGTNADAFSFDPTQWDDRDGDGYGDNPSPASQPDACPDIAGTSTKDGYGCLDADGDGWGLTDNCPNEAGNSTADKIGCSDVDGDDWSDSGDYDLVDPTVWSNIDGDEYPDQGGSTTLDSCPNEFGTSWLDRLGCADPDGDGWSSADGVWFIHPLGLADSHPTDASQWRDRDGDGYGDNQTGTNPDACPDLNGESKWNIVDGLRVSMLGCADNDGDGYTDDIDDCPISPGSSSGITWGCPDSDGDGIQDVNDDCPSQFGSSNANLKACPDSDGDGIADLEDPSPLTSLFNNGTITDWDGDGYENSNDSFVFEETQWNDTDGDGLGDEPTGDNPDPYPNDRDNDAWDDPNDLTTDDRGCLEKTESGKDAFPTDNREWLDSDGDCIGNNADSDDDNDGYSDNAELQAGTDPLSADSKPTESFEIVVPGTSIGLGAWDLIGMFGGIPLFAWLAFGFATRNRRAGKFEDQLRQAKSRGELEEIAVRSEYSLMLRLIGPHQGIRLERLRAELDDVLEGGQHPLDPMDQTSIVEASMPPGQELKSITSLPDEGPSQFATGVTDENGYEWLEHNGLQYYRSAGSDVDWEKWVD
jgi:hypothetical protein